MYVKDLLWVWSGLGVVIITYSTIQVRNQENLLTLCDSVIVRPIINQADGPASLWPPATIQGAETHYICMKWTCYEYEVGGCSYSYHNLQYNPVRNQENLLLLILPLSHQSTRAECGIASIWPPATIQGAKTLCTFMKLTCYEYEVGEVTQSYPNTCYKMACLLIIIACMAQYCNYWCKSKSPIDGNVIADVSRLVGGRGEEWKTLWKGWK